jgi:hypothetical protein
VPALIEQGFLEKGPLMNPEQVQAVAAIAQSILAFVAIVGTVAVSIFVYYGTRRIARMQYEQSIRDAWVAVDTAALENDATLLIADSLMDPHSEELPIERRRKRWLSYMMLNPLFATYSGLQEGLVNQETVKSLHTELGLILRDDDVYKITQSGIYPPSFAALCETLRKNFRAHHAVRTRAPLAPPSEVGSQEVI